MVIKRSKSLNTDHEFTTSIKKQILNLRLLDLGYFVIVILIVLAILEFQGQQVTRSYMSLFSISYNQTSGTIFESKKDIMTSGSRYTYREIEIYSIKYFYTINNKTYRSSRIKNSGKHVDVEDTLKKYPLMKDVTVYYSKNNPSRSILEPDNDNDDKYKPFYLPPFIAWFFVFLSGNRNKIKSLKNLYGK